MQPARRVLIVEDEEILAGNLKAHLERAACDACIAADGASAIGLVDAFAPALVVLDYGLPDMSGFEVLDAIRCRRCDAGCILITGHPSGEVVRGAQQRGIRHILLKPFPLVELSQVVCEMLQGPPAPAGGMQERRRSVRSDFPMRLYDGSWLHAERRRHDGAESHGA